MDNLIGLENDAFSQPVHRRSESSFSSAASSSSPTASMVALLPPSIHQPATHSMPIPRPSAQQPNHHRANHNNHNHKPQPPSIPQTPSSSAESTTFPFPFSPVLSPSSSSAYNQYQYDPSRSSYVSTQTTLTTPNSTSSLQTHYGQDGAPGGGGGVGGGPVLSYPSVPPPSLSSSLGSPTISYYIGTREPPSPVDPLSRRGSVSVTNGIAMNGAGTNGNGNGRRVVETGNLRRTSVERGGRIAETGTLASASGVPVPVPVRSGSGSATTGNVADSPVLGAFVPSLNETIE